MFASVLHFSQHNIFRIRNYLCFGFMFSTPPSHHVFRRKIGMIFCHRHMTLLWFYQHSGQMIAHAHYDRKFVIVNMENRCGTFLAGKFEVSEAETFTYCFSGIDPLRVSLHSCNFFTLCTAG